MQVTICNFDSCFQSLGGTSRVSAAFNAVGRNSGLKQIVNAAGGAPGIAMISNSNLASVVYDI